MRIEFISPYSNSPQTGIGRYLQTLGSHLSGFVDFSFAQPRFLPMANRFSTLRNLPIGIENHEQGSIVHFAQILGCAMMLYRPFHPSVATVHDLGYLALPEEWNELDPVARQVMRMSMSGLKHVDRIIANSEFTRQTVIKHLGVHEDRVVTIYPGIDHGLFRPISGARQSLSNRYPQLAKTSSSPWLLYVGSELPRKNVGTLLQAVSLLRKEIPTIQLIKIGSAGGERFRQETLRVVNSLDLMDRVLFFEGIGDEELALFYNASDLFVTASKLEGFGFPAVEAMACGTPVICLDRTSLKEVGDKAATFVSESDPVLFASTIYCSLENGNRQGVVQPGIKQAEKYNWSNTCQETLQFYSDFVN